MGISYILFDLDQTVYPPESGVFPEINRRMSDFVSRRLGVSVEEAGRLRRSRLAQYGTTLAWLLHEHELEDPEEFLLYTHPEDIHRYLDKDPGIRRALESIPIRKSILTNSIAEHARRVLAHLELEDLFERIYDLRYNSYLGKPAPALYTKVLDAIGFPAEEVLFLDDTEIYLVPFAEMGGQVLKIGPGPSEHGFPSLERISKLPEYLAGLEA